MKIEAEFMSEKTHPKQFPKGDQVLSQQDSQMKEEGDDNSEIQDRVD